MCVRVQAILAKAAMREILEKKLLDANNTQSTPPPSQKGTHICEHHTHTGYEVVLAKLYCARMLSNKSLTPDNTETRP
jgi:hypothetical protein